MADRPQTRDDWEPTMNLWCCMFYFFSPWKEHCHLWKKKTIPCVCFRPQHSWTVKLSIPNLNLDLKFTSRREKTTFSQGNDGKVLVTVSPLLVSGSHAAPLPDLPQFESNHKRPIGCSGHVTYLGPKSTAFSDWSRIFPMGAAYRASAVWACVCLRTLGKNLPPPLPLFPTSSPLSPFLSSFFHHLPSFETQYHTLDSLCCHGKEHSFLWRGHTECENAGGSLQNTEQKTRVRKCSNVAMA